ncbi:GDSL family lipase [Niastella koreensis]|uniref:Lipolytic protein G-D-S-L family n=2 Tax=Niastella koreensis TaxID=354356 RepID=G8TDL9_NIAKG|nr:GDSL-type esterase/lipase family protein [Niastella koreensis]AEW01469.1 lipolytic protein G-D-S-L family [Niastella koreensis GR20-10]OQP48198.1 GDSL family lipase [Niastella koreensis]
MKQRLILLLTLMMAAGAALAQTEPVDSSYANGYYVERMKFFDQLHPAPKPVVFLGNSITEAGPWSEILPGINVVNRGISGDNSWGVYNRLNQVIALKPVKIFLLIGVNDLKRGVPIEYIVANYDRIAATLRTALPKSTLYLQSVLPVAEPMLANIYAKISNEKIRRLNDGLKQVAQKYNCPFIDLYHEVFVDEKGQMPAPYTTDGLHCKPAGYLAWAAYLKKKKYL